MNVDKIIKFIEENNIPGIPNPISDLDKISLQDLRIILESYELAHHEPLLRRSDIVETLAAMFQDTLNEAGVDLRADYDDDQTEKIEYGRNFANNWLEQYKLVEVKDD